MTKLAEPKFSVNDLSLRRVGGFTMYIEIKKETLIKENETLVEACGRCKIGILLSPNYWIHFTAQIIVIGASTAMINL